MTTSNWVLDTPLRVGPMLLRGRVYVPAHQPGLAENGQPGERYIAYQRARARAGVAMQVTGATPIAPSRVWNEICLWNVDESIVPGYRAARRRRARGGRADSGAAGPPGSRGGGRAGRARSLPRLLRGEPPGRAAREPRGAGRHRHAVRRGRGPLPPWRPRRCRDQHGPRPAARRVPLAADQPARRRVRRLARRQAAVADAGARRGARGRRTGSRRRDPARCRRPRRRRAAPARGRADRRSTAEPRRLRQRDGRQQQPPGAARAALAADARAVRAVQERCPHRQGRGVGAGVRRREGDHRSARQPDRGRRRRRPRRDGARAHRRPRSAAEVARGARARRAAVRRRQRVRERPARRATTDLHGQPGRRSALAGARPRAGRCDGAGRRRGTGRDGGGPPTRRARLHRHGAGTRFAGRWPDAGVGRVDEPPRVPPVPRLATARARPAGRRGPARGRRRRRDGRRARAGPHGPGHRRPPGAAARPAHRRHGARSPTRSIRPRRRSGW